jgi:hypothetical protein
LAGPPSDPTWIGKSRQRHDLRAQKVCYGDMIRGEDESVLREHEDEVSALFRQGARKLNASHLASTVNNTAALPSTSNCRPRTSQCQPSAASLVTPITSQASALDWFSRVSLKQASLSTSCNSQHRPGLLSLASSRAPPSLLPASHHTPIFQEMPAQISSAAVLYADLLHPHFPPSITQHTSLYNLLDIQPISLRSLPPPEWYLDTPLRMNNPCTCINHWLLPLCWSPLLRQSGEHPFCSWCFEV